MAYEARVVQSTTPNTLPNGTDPMVDNTDSGDVQAIKMLDGTPGSVIEIQAGNGSASNALRVTLAEDGSGIIGVVIIGDVPVSNNGAPLGVSILPSPTEGLENFHLVSDDGANESNVAPSQANLYGWYIYNNNDAMRKVCFHNWASGPTAGESVMFSLPIPGKSGANVAFAAGIQFSDGIAITTVTGMDDNDATGVDAGDLVINLWFKRLVG